MFELIDVLIYFVVSWRRGFKRSCCRILNLSVQRRGRHAWLGGKGANGMPGIGNFFWQMLVIYFLLIYFHWCLCLKNLDGYIIQDYMNAIQSSLFSSHSEFGFDAFTSITQSTYNFEVFSTFLPDWVVKLNCYFWRYKN